MAHVKEKYVWKMKRLNIKIGDSDTKIPKIKEAHNAKMQKMQ